MGKVPGWALSPCPGAERRFVSMTISNSRPEEAALPSSSPSAAIEAVGLSKRYGGGGSGVIAVDSLHLVIAPGELFGFLGENGAGKTTTIKMLTGLIPPTAGEARIGGWDVRREPLQGQATGRLRARQSVFVR
jgi:ABC-type Fe3+/spermidine/putrescine transport system ATPase subunit